jgi:hypothetical protein
MSNNPNAQIELYNLASDVGEQKNVASNKPETVFDRKDNGCGT